MLLGVLLGVLGLALATPLAATAMVAINRLYVQELLGDSDHAEPAGTAPGAGP